MSGIILAPLLALFASLAQAGPAAPLARVDRVLLPADSRQLVEADLSSFTELELEASRDAWFTRIFGGATMADVVRYLDARVHFIGIDKEPDPAQSKSVTIASNYGPSFLTFLYGKSLGRHVGPERVPFERGTIQIRVPRVGFVALGPGYSRSLSAIGRMETLVHEARHSDCAHVPPLGELKAYDEERYADLKEATQACTHIHVPCPKGHPLAGELACDDHPWGAYSVAGVFARAIHKSCLHCTERQRQAALAVAADDMSRLTPALRRVIRSGSGPRPDMAGEVL